MTPGRAGSDGWLHRWARRDRRELAILLGGVAALLLVVAFFVLAAQGDRRRYAVVRRARAVVAAPRRRSLDPDRSCLAARWRARHHRSRRPDGPGAGDARDLRLPAAPADGAHGGVRIRRDHRRMGREQRSQGVVPASPAGSGAAPPRRDVAQLPERPRDDVGGGLPDPRGAHDAGRRASRREVLLHGGRDGRVVAGRREPRLTSVSITRPMSSPGGWPAWCGR